MLSALRLCVWLLDNRYIKLLCVDNRFPLTFRAIQWNIFKDSIFSDHCSGFISTVWTAYPLISSVFNHKPPAFLDYVLNFTAKLHSRKAYKIQNAFHIKQNANTHPHALPVLFLTISIPYIAINVVTISMIPQKEVLNG